MEMEEIQQPEVFESTSVKCEDVVITITALPDGILSGKTNEQIMKFSADILLRTTDNGSLENYLDALEAVKETLKEDYDWKDLMITQFSSNWRKRFYLKQIGQQNPPIEDAVTPGTVVEPSSDEENKEEQKPKVMVDDKNHVTIGIRPTKKILDDGKNDPNSFSFIDNEKPV